MSMRSKFINLPCCGAEFHFNTNISFYIIIRRRQYEMACNTILSNILTKHQVALVRIHFELAFTL